MRFYCLAFIASVHATALTAILAGSEKSCYYADVDGLGEKIGKRAFVWCGTGYRSRLGFYFAVQSGGAFDVDFVVMDPDDKILLEGFNERQGDYIFTANKVRKARTHLTFRLESIPFALTMTLHRRTSY
jgi:hypothetical protein